MPFKSKAQMGYLYSKHPEIANKWEHEFKQTGKNLPEHVKKHKNPSLSDVFRSKLKDYNK